ncbi:hypothetical protein GS432_18740 [Rhodococcus hoagii]|nr:hypothetical protein [Prescottella equi]
MRPLGRLMIAAHCSARREIESTTLTAAHLPTASATAAADAAARAPPAGAPVYEIGSLVGGV